MFDIGFQEFVVIGLLAMLVVGPERLPRMTAEAVRMLRNLRDQAASARDDLMAAADLDPDVTAELRRTAGDLAALHPRNLAKSVLTEGVLGQTARPGTPPPGLDAGPAQAVPPAAPSAVADGSTPYDSDAT